MKLLTTLWKHVFPQPSPLRASIVVMQVAGHSVLVATFGGIYGHGCAGHDAVAQMRRVVHEAFGQHPKLAGLVMDFATLEYTWADDLLLPLGYHPDWDAEVEPTENAVDEGNSASSLHCLREITASLRPFPVVYVISDLNRAGLMSLITHEVFDVEPKDVLFDSIAAATSHLSRVFEAQSVAV